MRPSADVLSPPLAAGQYGYAAHAASAPAPRALARKACAKCGERYPIDFRVCPRDATELQNAVETETDPLVGSVLGGTYELLRVIGEGAMGRVYEARHTRLRSKRFAIKVLHGELKRQSDMVERFLREADATSVVAHPNIVGVLDVNLVPDGRPYIVAELLHGHQLGDYLDRKGQLSVSEAVSICRQICEALMVAHGKGIVHRDIKPENVFLIGQGARRTVKVLDFGISRVDDPQAKLTKTGMVLGTPAYMPPEQAMGVRVDQRADVYSVGAILYEAVTGRRPFDDTDPIATLAAVITKEPTRPCTLNSRLPPALELLIQKAMAKKPAERYQSMRELDAALAEFDVPDESLPLPKLELLTGQHHRISLPSIILPERIARALGRSSLPVDDARAELLVVSGASLLSALLGLITVSTSILRLTRGAEPLRGSEIALAAFGSACLLIAPALLWARYVAERVWSSTPRVVSTSMSVCRMLFAGLVTYAAGMLLVRVFAGSVHAEASGTAWPGWDVLVFLLGSLAVGHAAWQERGRGKHDTRNLKATSVPPPAPKSDRAHEKAGKSERPALRR